jgi:hypothetical protein
MENRQTAEVADKINYLEVLEKKRTRRRANNRHYLLQKDATHW